MGIGDSPGWLVGADIPGWDTHLGPSSHAGPAQASHSLIGQENADVLLQAKKVGQVHGRGQVPWGVSKLEMG